MEEIVKKHIGKRLETAAMRDDALHLIFEDGCEIKLSDNGQDCCDTRYMTCDDDLESFRGDRFVGIEVLEAPEIEHRGGCHEVNFVNAIFASGNKITCQTHNEHHGYYGGFRIEVEEVTYK